MPIKSAFDNVMQVLLKRHQIGMVFFMVSTSSCHNHPKAPKKYQSDAFSVQNQFEKHFKKQKHRSIALPNRH